MIQFHCAGCSSVIRVDDRLAGRRGRCPRCHTLVEVPSARPEASQEDLMPALPEPALRAAVSSSPQGGSANKVGPAPGKLSWSLPYAPEKPVSVGRLIAATVLLGIGVLQWASTEKPQGFRLPVLDTHHLTVRGYETTPPLPRDMAVYRGMFTGWFLAGTVLAVRSLLPRRTWLRLVCAAVGGFALVGFVVMTWTYGLPAASLPGTIGMLLPALPLVPGFWFSSPRESRSRRKVRAQVAELRSQKRDARFCLVCGARGHTGWLVLSECDNCGGKGFVVVDVPDIAAQHPNVP
jgi:hypothetical protein